MAQPPPRSMHESSNASRTDWEAIFRRLEESRILLEKGVTTDRERAKTILRTRAKELARETESRVEHEWLEVVEFQLAHEIYGLASDALVEVFPLKDLTPLPGVPSFVRGIINVRGHIFSIVDLKRFFDLPDRGITDLNKVILLQQGGMELGILADVVFGIRRVEIAMIQPAPPTLNGNRADYLQGLTPDGLIVLDAAKILMDPQLIIRDEIEA